jgi:hypothetical protein
LLRVVLVFCSGPVPVETPWEDAVVDVKAPDFKIEMDFVAPLGCTLAEALAVLPAACLLTAPPEREKTY